jgi:cation diffusion facilitator family transporter
VSRPAANSQSVGTVVVAGAANLTIAVAKAVAGLVSGSAAMLSEAAHSVAGTVTEALLFTSLHRRARPADAARPFGYGKESYVWALLAALFTFVAGAGFSVTRGLDTIRSGEQPGSFTASYIVLAVAFAAESASLTRAIRQVRGEAARWRITNVRFLRLTADTAVKAVVLEDAAALIGLVLAGAGLGLTALTGDPVWDGLASVGIGLLLLAVAVILARTNVSLLVGRAVPARLRELIHDEIAAIPTVEHVSTLFTMQLGPDDILVAAKIDFTDEASGADIKAAAEDAERRLVTRLPAVRYVFLDPTPSGGEWRGPAAGP